MRRGWSPGIDTLRLKFRSFDPGESKWRVTEETDERTGDVTENGKRLPGTEPGFDLYIPSRGAPYLTCVVSARLGRGHNLELITPSRLVGEVVPRLAELFDASGIRVDLGGALLSRVDYAVDVYPEESPIACIKAVAERIDLGRHFWPSEIRPNSKKWVTGEDRHARTFGLYDKGLEAGVAQRIVRVEGGWHEARTIRSAMGIGTLGELIENPHAPRKAFRRLIEPALPEPVVIESDEPFDLGSLYERVDGDARSLYAAVTWGSLEQSGMLTACLEMVGARKGAKAKSNVKAELDAVASVARACLTPNAGRDRYALMRRLLLAPLQDQRQSDTLLPQPRPE